MMKQCHSFGNHFLMRIILDTECVYTTHLLLLHKRMIYRIPLTLHMYIFHIPRQCLHLLLFLPRDDPVHNIRMEPEATFYIYIVDG